MERVKARETFCKRLPDLQNAKNPLSFESGFFFLATSLVPSGFQESSSSKASSKVTGASVLGRDTCTRVERSTMTCAGAPRI